MVTPCADIVGVEGMGLTQVILDPRTTLAQGLHAQSVAELADVAGWGMLVELVERLGQPELAARFRDAEARERVHSVSVMRWLKRHAELAAGVERPTS